MASPALALPVIAARAGAKPPPEPSNREKPPNLVAFLCWRYPAHGCAGPRDAIGNKPQGRSRRPFEVAGRLMKFPKVLRLRLELAALRLAIVTARAMPVQLASWLSGNLSRLIAPRLGRQKRALARISHWPSPKSRWASVRRSPPRCGKPRRTFAESFRIKTLTQSDRIVFEPAEGFDEAARGDKPFIVCGLHLGNWEILAHGGQRLGVSLLGVYQRLSNPHVEALLHSMREPLYKAGLMPKTSHDCAGSLARHQGRRLPMLPCRSPRRPRRACALLRTTGAVKRLSSAPRPQDWRAALRRRRVPPSGWAFQHPHRAHFHAAHGQQRGGRPRCDANAAAPVRGFHPRGARTMDVGAREVGLGRHPAPGSGVA